MLIKQADDKASAVAELERLTQLAIGPQRAQVEQELRFLRAGLKGEQESAYLIDFDFKASKNWMVIHDLRLESGGRVAQVDHLLINRFLECFVLETKHFGNGLKITDDGEFLRWNDYKKTYEGMASPLAQNDRHIAVLRDVFKTIEMPSRLGIRMEPTFHSYVMVSPNARIDRPKKYDTSNVIKADSLRATIDKQVEGEGIFQVVGSVAKIVAADTVENIAHQLAKRHVPFRIDYAAKFGIDPQAKPTPEVKPAASGGLPAGGAKPSCKACGNDKLTILYGKYGYYFKCAACDGNTAIKLDCGQPGHKERLRKDGPRFFRECADCKSSSLFFVNPT